MVEHSVFLSLEDRDGMVQSGMQGGASETNDRFKYLLANGQTGLSVAFEKDLDFLLGRPQ